MLLSSTVPARCLGRELAGGPEAQGVGGSVAAPWPVCSGLNCKKAIGQGQAVLEQPWPALPSVLRKTAPPATTWARNGLFVNDANCEVNWCLKLQQRRSESWARLTQTS